MFISISTKRVSESGFSFFCLFFLVVAGRNTLGIIGQLRDCWRRCVSDPAQVAV